MDATPIVTEQSEIAAAEAERLIRSADRVCGGCRACCTVLGVAELDKKMLTPCKHECDVGCAIYPSRPPTCQSFTCLWRGGWGTEAMRPDLCGFILDVQSQPGIYTFAQGFMQDPPLIVVAYPTAGIDVFAGATFSLVRQNLLKMGAVLMEFRVDTVVLFGIKYPTGGTFQARAEDGDPTRMTIHFDPT